METYADISPFIFHEMQGDNTALPTKKFQSVFISDARIKQLKIAVNEQKEPTYTAYLQMKKIADQNLDRIPTATREWYVPGYYVDAEGHRTAKNGLCDDANAAYAQALCYRMTDQKKYAEAAIKLINAWVNTLEVLQTKDDSRLSFSYHFPAFILAADLLRDENVWPDNEQKGFEIFLREKALPMSTIKSKNNWGNWGLVLSSACAVYLNDRDLFQTCVDRWKYFIEDQIASDGHMPHEVHRSEGMRGIWYSHFSLMPQTVAAEILKINGADLYNYRSPSGRTLESAFKKIAAWTRFPESFPYWEGDPKKLTGRQYISYFEILNVHWPNGDATSLLRKKRPLTATHSTPYMTFSHGAPITK
jgi:hypothetical protein